MINKLIRGWTYKKLVGLSFLCGLVCMGAAHSLIQDWYGLEAYIQHCREGWISGWYTVPIAIAILAVGIVGQWAARSIASRYDKLSEEDD